LKGRMNTLLVNLFGAPCSGKSVKMMQLAVHAKLQRVFCEISAEVAKEYVVPKIPITRDVQLQLSMEQARRLNCFVGHAAVVVTDAPIMIGAFYSRYRNLHFPGDLEKVFPDLAASVHINAQQIVNVYIWRDHPYDESGRLESECEDQAIANDMWRFVQHHTRGQPLIEAKSTDAPDQLWTRILAAAAICPLTPPAA
jgi:hypothetical protein